MATGTAVNEFYDGSLILEPLTEFIGLSVDKVRLPPSLSYAYLNIRKIFA